MPPVRALLLAAVVCAAGPLRAAVLREAAGLVQVRSAGADSWRPAGRIPRALDEGDGLRTGYNARARVELFADTAFEAGGNAHLSIETDGPGRTSINAMFGAVRLTASAAGGRAVSIRTPTCVVRARAERVVLRVTVSGGGSALIEVEQGAAGIEDNHGGAVLVSAGWRAEVDLAGVHEPTGVPSPTQARKIDFLSSMRRELGFELGRDADFAAAARVSRREERELGRVLTDSSGRRVRVEEFVVRPAADRLALVVLNGRPDGLSYYSWDGAFDRALPRNLEPVFAGFSASAALTPWTLTACETTRSNGTDFLVERGEGGHQVDVNANADPSDDVSGGGAAYRTLFDRFGLYVNGVLKRGFTGADLQSYADKTASAVSDPLTGAALGAPLPTYGGGGNVTFPDAASARRMTLESYDDGTSIAREEMALGFGGGVAPRASFASPDRNVEERTSFGGREIRVVFPTRAASVMEPLP